MPLSVPNQEPLPQPSTTTGWASKYFYLNPVLFNLLFLTVTEHISHWTITTNSSTIISRDTKPNKSKETNRFQRGRHTIPPEAKRKETFHTVTSFFQMAYLSVKWSFSKDRILVTEHNHHL
ncbi:hypothetical protein L873DRAFT_1812624 [Choiromyces venosus 120613-1]|uniref:Uncharacterized protein n=1 Tax=Choiromyces venosus 120613-1 TaxID=1336337 RepID=A0A3N4JBJ4_9PEZI|nr:hypothetical protein L873DRAFT_1812624 [Choiromyces venosus 120613-1]